MIERAFNFLLLTLHRTHFFDNFRQIDDYSKITTSIGKWFDFAPVYDHENQFRTIEFTATKFEYKIFILSGRLADGLAV